MKFYLSCLLCLALFQPGFVNAQENKEKIAKALTDYFHLDRENIHVHFDKNIFLTDEQIWFKGYVFHRKLNIPFFATTNVYANLIDTDGNIVDSQLLYGNIATFSGSFKLNDSFKSGKYYLQFYTNWMNNFTEDESSVYEIEIINPEYGAASPLGRNDYSKIHINFHPEGGTLLQGASNSVGINLADCNNNPVSLSSVDIVTAAGEIIKTVQINKLGYGRFDLEANSHSGLKAVATINGVKYEQALPAAQIKGIALEVNNYSITDKLIAKIKTNKVTNTFYEGKPFYMVIQQDEKVLIIEFGFKNGKLEQTIALSQSELFNGTNTIRILDAELNQLAERLVYKYPNNDIKTEVKNINPSPEFTALTITTSQPLMNLSVSIVPEKSISINQSHDIFGSLLILPYIGNRKNIVGRYYFDTFSKVKQYELDLFLLNQDSKYKWRDILNNPPKSNHKFEMGLALKATINSNISKKKNSKIRVFSFENLIEEQVTINETGEIYLDNLILTDSTKVEFSLFEEGEKKQVKLYPQIFNNTRKFIKGYKPAKTECTIPANMEDTVIELPGFYPITIVLKELELTANKKALKYKKVPGNSQLRGYKIGEHESKSFFYILDYIRYQGFDVSDDGVHVSINGRTINTINGQRTQPMVYIDNMRLLSFEVLQNVQTGDVDEIFINPHAVVPSVDNKMGIIRIYMKKGFNRSKDPADTSLIVQNGFSRHLPFDNANYNSTADKGFVNFGIIDWDSAVLPNSTGEFTIEIPQTSQETVKVLIEGFSADGKLVSEIKTIKLN